mgnify:CR=1 FL=1
MHNNNGSYRMRYRCTSTPSILETVKVAEVNVGDLVRQLRLPGGICIFLKEEKTDCEDVHDWTVIHPTEGLIVDADYYYEELTGRDSDNEYR